MKAKTKKTPEAEREPVSYTTMYPVKILDKNGKVKKIIETDELQTLHWSRFSQKRDFTNDDKKFTAAKSVRSIDEESFHAQFREEIEE